MTAGPLSIAPREDQLWPTLTPAQIARIEKHGKRRAVQAGDVRIEAGQEEFPLFVVLDGVVEVVRAACEGQADHVVVTHNRGSFSAALNLLSGRRPAPTALAAQSAA